MIISFTRNIFKKTINNEVKEDMFHMSNARIFKVNERKKKKIFFGV